MNLGVPEQRKNIDEVDSRNWEVREGLESAEESYLCTGEFGGTGGGGGGLSSRGIVACGRGRSGGGVLNVLIRAGRRRNLRSVGVRAHDGERRRRGEEGEKKFGEGMQDALYLIKVRCEGEKLSLRQAGWKGVHPMLGV